MQAAARVVRMTTTICDPKDKNTLFVYVKENNRLTSKGYVHCVSATEWQVYNASGEFLDWAPSKAAAIAAL